MNSTVRQPVRQTAYLRHRRAGLSLIEVAISTLLVGVMLVGALRCVGSVIDSRTRNADAAIAERMAQQLMTEICNAAYVEPGGSTSIGPEESTDNRSQFDDVDDYHFWNSNPPQDKNGTPLANRANWWRAATVHWVDPTDVTQTTDQDLGLKRITVYIIKNGEPLRTQVALRSEKADR